ncbi:NAD(P)-dependent dehydrogenase, short-chain alcohol dehydrogenase family [Asanoa hainanensis]|uniref:Probable oxidoreductase n=1 Tax=Asanoa hainanensis TaxID=560556 RepID=A0A239GSZ5_9ACTN|nr:SDR family NAD(P)-dependent oxidoreductase [Asanoa hainanensis]SNS72081.1 NAD(P)-dependent dehydrogenase, short-chain alcohol dehydrogenase family [Asanoa hainanensis]
MAFGAESTAAEVVAGVDLAGQRAVVTGGGSGIGLATAKALAAAGAQVTVAVRDPAQGRAAGLRWELLDLADLGSVRAFANRWTGPLHILVNNAGVMRTPEAHTPQGWELQFATNHLGHFALSLALHPALGGTDDGGRVVAVTSASHLRAPVDFEDINFAHRAYDPTVTYDQSKTANVLFAVEAARRWAHDGVTVNAVNPGGVRGNLQRHLSEAELADMDERAAAGPGWKSAEQGAATSAYVASAPGLAGESGRYFEDCHEAGLHQAGMPGGVAPYAVDPANAARLWEISAEAVGVG